MSDPALRAIGLTYSLTLPSGTLELLRGVDLTVHEGQSAAIVGRSGSGKTTLLTLLGLMGRPDGGVLEIRGITVSSLGDDRAARFRNREIGFVFQNYSLVPHLSVLQNVMLPFMYGRAVRSTSQRAAALNALDLVELTHLADSKPAKLSGGEQQRVAIARALVREPAVVLADEPTGALDVDTGDHVIDLLHGVAAHAGACLVVVTHDPDIAARMDCRYELKDGHVTAVPHPSNQPPRRLDGEVGR